MLEITKNKTPVFFTKAKKSVSRPLDSSAWKDEHIAKIRQNLREHILREEQFHLCAYCEKKIGAAKKDRI